MKYYIRRTEAGALVLPVIRTQEGPAVDYGFYKPAQEADSLDPHESREVEALLSSGDYERVYEVERTADGRRWQQV